MDKHFNVGTQITIAGRSNVSRHLEYVFNMICHKHAPKLVNLITFRADDMKGFGSSHGSAASMAINVSKHFESSLKTCKENPQYSLRGMLIMELINTCHHELKHIMLEDDSALIEDALTQENEDASSEFAGEHWWDSAKYINLEMVSLGPILDKLLADFITSLKNAEMTGEMTDWQEQQLYMVDNGIIYQDTRKSVVLKCMYDFCHYFSKNDNGWNGSLPIFEDWEEFNEPEAAVTTPEPVVETTMEPETGSIEPTHVEVETPAPIVDEGVLVMQEGEDILSDMETCVNPFETEDIYAADLGEDEHNDMSEAYSADDHMVANTAPSAPASVASAPSPEMVRLQNITKLVMRRLFTSIYSKCEWDGRGRFNNAGAVLDPVNIGDIEGASEIFTHVDAVDASGVYVPHHKVDGFIKGVVSQQGLPMYRMYLTINGQELKRTFVPQNPAKVKTDGVTPTAWAAKVLNGTRLAMLLPDSGSPKLKIELSAGDSLGLEKVEECNWGNR